MPAPAVRAAMSRRNPDGAQAHIADSRAGRPSRSRLSDGLEAGSQERPAALRVRQPDPLGAWSSGQTSGRAARAGLPSVARRRPKREGSGGARRAGGVGGGWIRDRGRAARPTAPPDRRPARRRCGRHRSAKRRHRNPDDAYKRIPEPERSCPILDWHSLPRPYRARRRGPYTASPARRRVPQKMVAGPPRRAPGAAPARGSAAIA
jgi:hypothetical protein